jgi:hypothetical protein
MLQLFANLVKIAAFFEYHPGPFATSGTGRLPFWFIIAHPTAGNSAFGKDRAFLPNRRKYIRQTAVGTPGCAKLERLFSPAFLVAGASRKIPCFCP